MFFIDTHTHLFSDSFNEDRNEVVERAIHSGVKYLLLPNIDIESIPHMYSLCGSYPENCFPMMGLHPGSVGANWKKDLEVIERNLYTNKHVAVGEIGMDLYWDKTFINEQKKVFSTQVNWAKDLNLPIVIHAREAFDEIFEIIDKLNSKELRGIFHCFTGNLEQAKHINSYGGFKIGIGGVLTYKKAGLAEILPDIPLENIVLETDSPYLPPVPFRGKRNESSYLIHVAEKLAEIKNVSVEVIAEKTTRNALEIFNLNPSVNEAYLSLKGQGAD